MRKKWIAIAGIPFLAFVIWTVHSAYRQGYADTYENAHLNGMGASAHAGVEAGFRKYSRSNGPKIDYPLIDLYFDSDPKYGRWLIVNRSYSTASGKETIKVIEKPQNIEHVKETLYVTTFPVGHGAIPKGEILVYEDGQLVKQVPYLSINDSGIRGEYKTVTKIQLKALIGN